MSGGIEVCLHPFHFARVFSIGAAFEAGCEAHLHFGINAAGKFRIGMKVVDAAAHFEKIEGVVHEFFGGEPGDERPVVQRKAVDFPQTRCD